MGTGDGGRAEAPPNPHCWRCPPASAREGGGGEACLRQQIFLEGESRCPKIAPSHVGTECKNAVCSDGRAGGQGRWVHLPQRHDGCLVSPCPSRASLPRAGHRASDQGADSLQKRRDLHPPLWPQASLPSSLPPWGSFPTHPELLLLQRHLLLPGLLSATRGPGAGPPAGSQGAISLKRQLPCVSSQCTHPEHRDAEAESPSPGEGLGCTLSPGTSLLIQGFLNPGHTPTSPRKLSGKLMPLVQPSAIKSEFLGLGGQWGRGFLNKYLIFLKY